MREKALKDTILAQFAEEVGSDAVSEEQKKTMLKRMEAGGEKLSQAEIEFANKYSDKVPRIAEITRYAQSEAIMAKEKDPSVPEDAYRHILWGYLLTKEFGPAFAKEVTDTHEVGPTGNTPAEREMDYNNNAVGRGYATGGLPQSQIIERIKTDPRVIRRAN